MLGIEELSADDQQTVRRARRLERFLTQPFFVTEMFTGHTGRHVPLEQTLAGCEAILDGKYDDRDEAALYMIGPIEEADMMSLLEPGDPGPDGVVARGPVYGRAGGRCQRPVSACWPGHERFLTVLVPACSLSGAMDRESFAAVDGGVLLLEDGPDLGRHAGRRHSPTGSKTWPTWRRHAGGAGSRANAARSGFAELEASLMRKLRKAEARR